jgi:type IV pilus assembly protein PilM
MASFFDSFKNIFSKGHKGASVGIDIGTSSIKIVEIEKIEERAVLKNYGEIILGPRGGASVGQATNLSPEKIAEALKDLFRETGIVPRHALLTIPASASLISLAELPDVGKKELEGMITIEARRYIPMAMSEVSLDWWILPKTKKEKREPKMPTETQAPLEKIEVVIAAIHNEVLKKYETIQTNAQIPSTTSHFEIEIFSTLRSVVGRDLDSVLVVDMGASTTKLVIVDGGAMRGSHVVSVGGQDITLGLSRAINISVDKAEEIKRRVGMIGDEEGRDVRAVSELLLSNVMNETARFAENFEQKYNTKIGRIIFVGGGSRLKGLDAIVRAKFSQAKVEMGDPFIRLDSPAFLATTLSELSPTFAPAIGIALKGLEE